MEKSLGSETIFMETVLGSWRVLYKGQHPKDWMRPVALSFLSLQLHLVENKAWPKSKQGEKESINQIL